MSSGPVVVPEIPQPIIYRPRYRPVATYAILAVNFVVFLFMTLAGGSVNPETLLDFGASYGPYLHRGEYWRLVMPMFLHIGGLHLLANSISLLVLGRILEVIYGYGWFSFLYVSAGVGGSLLSMLVRRNAVGGGASGAIFGIAGAMVVVGYLYRDAIPRRLGHVFRGRLPFVIIANFIVLHFIPFVDNWAHLGGLAGGTLLALLIPPPRPRSIFAAEEASPSQAILAVPVIVVALAMAVTVGHYQKTQEMSKLLQEGQRLHKAHQNAEAIQRFQEAAHRSPHDERPHEQLGSMYLEEKRLDDAITEYNEALRLNRGSAPAQLGLALAYRQKGDIARSRQLFEALLGKNPENAESQMMLADLYAEQKFYQEAIQHYQRALRLKPNMAEAHNNLAWLLATSEDPKYRDPRAALDHARLAVELTRWKQPEFVDTLAEAYYVNQNFAEAVRVQTKTLELAPNRREYQEHMARYRKAAGA